MEECTKPNILARCDQAQCMCAINLEIRQEVGRKGEERSSSTCSLSCAHMLALYFSQLSTHLANTMTRCIKIQKKYVHYEIIDYECLALFAACPSPTESPPADALPNFALLNFETTTVASTWQRSS